MNDPEAKIRADIAKYGWHCLSVFPQEGETGCGFAYTIGLFETYKHPEIIIFDLPKNVMHGVLSECADMIEAGTSMPLETPVPDILSGDYKVYFKKMKLEFFPEYLGTAMRHYKHQSFPAIVLFWPDKKHLYPWQSSSNTLQSEALNVV